MRPLGDLYKTFINLLHFSEQNFNGKRSISEILYLFKISESLVSLELISALNSSLRENILNKIGLPYF